MYAQTKLDMYALLLDVGLIEAMLGGPISQFQLLAPQIVESGVTSAEQRTVLNNFDGTFEI